MVFPWTCFGSMKSGVQIPLPRPFLLGIIYERPEPQRLRFRGLSIRRTFTVSSKAPETSSMLGVDPSRFPQIGVHALFEFPAWSAGRWT